MHKIAEKTAAAQQLRPQGGDLWYSPQRDITRLLPALVREAIDDLDNEDLVFHREFKQWTKDRFWTQEDLCSAAEGLAAFMSEEGIMAPSIGEAYDASGLASLPIHLRVLLFATIGEEALAAFWYGIKSATRLDSDGHPMIEQYDADGLAALSRELIDHIRMSPWQRFKRRAAKKVRSLIERVFPA